MTTALILSPAPAVFPAALFTPTPKAAQRALKFFTAQINNDHTRKSYLNATRRFAAWCEAHGLHQLADVQPFHVAAFVKDRPLIVGIRLRAVGAKIQGLLQLDYSVIPFVLAFDRSCFTDWITFEKSRLVGLEITGTRLKKSIYAAGLWVSGSVQIWNESVVEGQLFFDGATISGDLRCDRSVLMYKKWPEDLRLNEPAYVEALD